MDYQVSSIYMSDEKPLISSMELMLKKPDFLFPFVASQKQFRTHYYGLTAAALLEYFFIDMYSSYLSQFDPVNKLELPPHGTRGWDYALTGYRVSHKVAKHISNVSALWDATIDDNYNLYNSEDSIMYSLSQHAKQNGKLIYNEFTLKIKPISEFNNSKIKPNESILLVNKVDKFLWKVIDLKKNATNDTLYADELIPFRSLWQNYSQAFASHANSFEMYLVGAEIKSEIPIESIVHIEFDFFPGLYLLGKEFLKDIQLTKNNRSNFLIPAAVIKQNLATAIECDRFIAMPTWFESYAPPRPPNLYLSQKQDYDYFFANIQRR